MLQKKTFCLLILNFLIAYGYAETNHELSKEQAKSLANQYRELADYYDNIADDQKAKKRDTKANKKSKSLSLKERMKGTKLTAGGSFHTGNTTTNTFNGELLLYYNPNTHTQGWLHRLDTHYNFASTQEKGTTENRLSIKQETSYNFDQNNGVFVEITYQRDQFDGYRYQLFENIGYKRLLFKNNVMKIATNLGPGLVQRQNTQSDTFENNFNWLTKLDFKWQLTKYASLKQTLTNNASSINTNTTWEIELNTQVTNTITLSLAYELSYDSKPVENKVHLNTISSINIVYQF
jgi:putative salt-induced outer membrane protein YdiY